MDVEQTGQTDSEQTRMDSGQTQNIQTLTKQVYTSFCMYICTFKCTELLLWIMCQVIIRNLF